MEIDYPGYEIRPAVDDWHHLLILHYLDLADGTPLSQQLMAFGDLPSGMVRGGGFDRQSEKELSLRLGSCQPEQVAQACRALGAALVPSNADICAVTLGPHGDKAFARRLINLGQERCLESYAAFFEGASRRQLEYFYAFVCAGSIGLLEKWLSEGTPQNVEEIARMTEDIIMYGIGFLQQGT